MGIVRALAFAGKYGLLLKDQKEIVRLYIQELMLGDARHKNRSAVRLVKELSEQYGFSSDDLRVMAQEVYKGTFDEPNPDWSERGREKARMHVYQWFMDGEEDVEPQITVSTFFSPLAVVLMAKSQSQNDQFTWLVMSALMVGLSDSELDEFVVKNQVHGSVLALFREVGVVTVRG